MNTLSNDSEFEFYLNHLRETHIILTDSGAEIIKSYFNKLAKLKPDLFPPYSYEVHPEYVFIWACNNLEVMIRIDVQYKNTSYKVYKYKRIEREYSRDLSDIPEEIMDALEKLNKLHIMKEACG